VQFIDEFDLFHHQRAGVAVFIHHSVSNAHAAASLPTVQMQSLFAHCAEVLNHTACCFMDLWPWAVKGNSSERIYMSTTYFLEFIIATCVVIDKVCYFCCKF